MANEWLVTMGAPWGMVNSLVDMEDSWNGGRPKWLVYVMETPIKMDDESGYAYFRKPPSGELKIYCTCGDNYTFVSIVEQIMLINFRNFDGKLILRSTWTGTYWGHTKKNMNIFTMKISILAHNIWQRTSSKTIFPRSQFDHLSFGGLQVFGGEILLHWSHRSGHGPATGGAQNRHRDFKR